MTDTEELCRQVADALEETFGDLRRPVVRNLAHLVVGLVMALRVSIEGLVWETLFEWYLQRVADIR